MGFAGGPLALGRGRRVLNVGDGEVARLAATYGSDFNGCRCHWRGTGRVLAFAGAWAWVGA